jgi:16S rRNA (uracil1498-N3)-methyltransferase
VSAPRFFVPDLDPSGDEVVLPPDESRHLTRVLRLHAEDELIVFDGRGRAWRARVVGADHRRTTVRLGDALPSDTEPRAPLVIVQAVLKGDGMDTVVRDVTMAGASRIVPVLAERSQVRAASLERPRAGERWMRIAIASAKQSGRARLPIIDRPRAFAEWLAEPFDGIRLLLAEPGASAGPPHSLKDVLSGRRSGAIACIVGPEGGWSVAECQSALDAGCAAVSLGTMTLRADAAGLVAASLISYALQET